MTETISPAQLVSELITLHRFKDRKYKDAWRKRGELIGIFSNIARKYDRLAVAQDEDDPDAAEPRADTAADLCIYSIKYLTWLVEHDPSAATAIAGAHSSEWSGTHGHRAVVAALQQLGRQLDEPPNSIEVAFATVAGPFTELEQILVEQHATTAEAKAALAWELAAGSLAYLWRLALDAPLAWRKFTADVANLS